MGHDQEMAEAQRDEARHARESARRDKEAAKAEHESAQVAKGEHRAKQPDDFSML